MPDETPQQDDAQTKSTTDEAARIAGEAIDAMQALGSSVQDLAADSARLALETAREVVAKLEAVVRKAGGKLPG